jgi:hypothetical protein
MTCQEMAKVVTAGHAPLVKKQSGYADQHLGDLEVGATIKDRAEIVRAIWSSLSEKELSNPTDQNSPGSSWSIVSWLP